MMNATTHSRLRVGAIALGATAAVGLIPLAGAAAAPHPMTINDCTYHQLKVREGGGDGATGHISFAIQFKNISGSTCSLTGYPGAAGLNKHGKQVTQARRSKRGFMGGLKPGHRIPTVTLTPGHWASAIIEGTDVPEGNKPCPALKGGLLVTPPNTRKSTHLRHAPPDCSGLNIHPVVAGKSGQQK